MKNLFKAFSISTNFVNRVFVEMKLKSLSARTKTRLMISKKTQNISPSKRNKRQEIKEDRQESRFINLRLRAQKNSIIFLSKYLHSIS